MRHPLAHRGGIALTLTLLVGSGAMCPKCGHGTRVTSKKWARCKKCDTRVARRRRERETPATKIDEANSTPRRYTEDGRLLIEGSRTNYALWSGGKP